MYVWSKTTKRDIQELTTASLLHNLIFCAVVRHERDAGHQGARAEQVQIIRELAKRPDWGLADGNVASIIDFES